MTSTKKILLVDDSTTVLMMERLLVKSAGFDFVTASDGEEALAKAVAERPDLILLDVCMPRMDGFEACRRLRGEPRTSHIPIVMVTTRGEQMNRAHGIASGASAYLTKPFNSSDLLSTVRQLLGA